MKNHTHLHKKRILKLRNSGFAATEIARFTGCPYSDVKEIVYGSVSREKRNKQRKRMKCN